MNDQTKMVARYGARAAGALLAFHLAGKKLSPVAALAVGAVGWLAVGWATDKVIGA